MQKKLCRNYAKIMQKLCKIMQKLCNLNVPGLHNYACIMQKLCKLCKNYANYASLQKLCKLCILHFADELEASSRLGGRALGRRPGRIMMGLNRLDYLAPPRARVFQVIPARGTGT